MFGCVVSTKIQILKAIHNLLTISATSDIGCVVSTKIQILKAIHNLIHILTWQVLVGNYKLKYNFESNSQPVLRGCGKFKVGNYKLKYNFESNSQPINKNKPDEFSWKL